MFTISDCVKFYSLFVCFEISYLSACLIIYPIFCNWLRYSTNQYKNMASLVVQGMQQYINNSPILHTLHYPPYRYIIPKLLLCPCCIIFTNSSPPIRSQKFSFYIRSKTLRHTKRIQNDKISILFKSISF